MRAVTFVAAVACGSCMKAGNESFFWFVALMIIIGNPVRWIAEFQDNNDEQPISGAAPMILRVYWKIKGQHAHLRVFVGREDENTDNFAAAGNLVLTAAEFIHLTQMRFTPEWIEEEDGG